VYNDRIIALELKAEPASIVLVQVYMSTSKYQDDQVDEMYNINEVVLEEDTKGETNTSKWETGTVWLVTNHTETLLDHKD
jgi:hypothetical protein